MLLRYIGPHDEVEIVLNPGAPSLFVAQGDTFEVDGDDEPGVRFSPTTFERVDPVTPAEPVPPTPLEA